MQSIFCKETCFSLPRVLKQRNKCCDVFVEINLEKIRGKTRKNENQAALKLRKFSIFSLNIKLVDRKVSNWIYGQIHFEVDVVNNQGIAAMLSPVAISVCSLLPSKAPTSTIIHNSNYNCFCQKKLLAQTNYKLFITHSLFWSGTLA